jgi:hypothetical protein
MGEPLTPEEEADRRARPWDATWFLDDLWATLDAERAKKEAALMALGIQAEALDAERARRAALVEAAEALTAWANNVDTGSILWSGGEWRLQWKALRAALGEE